MVGVYKIYTYIYIDTNIFISMIECEDPFSSSLRDFFTSLESNNQVLVTSELTLAECLIGAFKKSSDELVNIYTTLLQESDILQIVPVSRDILKSAALYSAKNNIKLPDSIHIVTAIGTDCTVFFSNDR
jgi:predicted nucleic acid-binding protein